MRDKKKKFNEWLRFATKSEIELEYQDQWINWFEGTGYYNTAEMDEMKIQLDLFNAYEEERSNRN